MGNRKVNWDLIKTEYVTGEDSQKKLAEKYGVSMTEFRGYAKTWYKERLKYREKATKKAINKACDREANRLAKIIETSRKLTDHIARAVEDPEQFNRWLCETTTPDGSRNTEEKIFRKVDIKSVNEAMKALQAAEKLERSINNILTLQEEQQLQIAREKWEAEKKQMATEHQKEDLVITFAQEDTEGWSI